MTDHLTDPATIPASLPGIIDRLRAPVAEGRTTVGRRLDRLRRMRRMLVEREADLAAALARDLGKPRPEAAFTETGQVIAEIDHLLRRVRFSALPAPVPVPLAFQPALAWTRREPYGTVLVIAPWNYPVNLTLVPLAGALAAGNTAVVKPSETAPATSALLARLLPRYLGEDTVAVIEGGKEVTTALLEHRFDMIVYTGGARVGRIVAEAAARHLTPVLLELGGKSPVWVDEGVDLTAAARRIAWGKLMNAGQTCVAPDYVLCTPAVADRLAPLLWEAVRELYGDDPQRSPDFGRAVSDDAAARLRELAGLGPAPRDDPRYVPPTVLTGDGAEAAMAEEIFGPLLPLVTVDPAEPVDSAISFIRSREKPLALYVFSGSAVTRKRFERETSSGAIGFGVPTAHLAVPGLPLGGVGGSGYGNYHGRWSLESFSHRKAVLSKPLRPDTLRAGYPPFGKLARALTRFLVR